MKATKNKSSLIEKMYNTAKKVVQTVALGVMVVGSAASVQAQSAIDRNALFENVTPDQYKTELVVTNNVRTVEPSYKTNFVNKTNVVGVTNKVPVPEAPTPQMQVVYVTNEGKTIPLILWKTNTKIQTEVETNNIIKTERIVQTNWEQYAQTDFFKLEKDSQLFMPRIHILNGKNIKGIEEITDQFLALNYVLVDASKPDTINADKKLHKLYVEDRPRFINELENNDKYKNASVIEIYVNATESRSGDMIFLELDTKRTYRANPESRDIYEAKRTTTDSREMKFTIDREAGLTDIIDASRNWTQKYFDGVQDVQSVNYLLQFTDSSRIYESLWGARVVKDLQKDLEQNVQTEPKPKTTEDKLYDALKNQKGVEQTVEDKTFNVWE